MSLLEVSNVKKIYSTRFGGNKVQALSNVTFSVEKGEFVAIMGESTVPASAEIKCRRCQMLPFPWKRENLLRLWVSPEAAKQRF